ncbi:MAG: HlyC/CorC family transporter [Planctomycetaceae bacterium]|nr:HlyC/CorC family transporter [Planctomycetales bacterium]MCB9924193.1 HlyC/CorC family transporter [Planctomycetaceae bacterium]
MIVLLLVMGNAFFVSSENSLTSARRSRIKHLAETGHAAAQIAQQLQAKPKRFCSVPQIGITLVSLGLGLIGVVTANRALEPAFEFVTTHLGSVISPASARHVGQVAAHVVAFVVVSYVHVVGGELAPKMLALHKPVEISLLVAGPISFVYRAMAWAIWLLNASASRQLWICGQRRFAGPAGGHFSISEEELRTILAASEQEGVLQQDETKMIRGVFDLDVQTTRDLMVPRTQIVALPQTANLREPLAVFRKSKHSRFPVYQGTIDTITGTLFTKELLESIDPNGDSAALERSIAEIMRPPYMVPDTKSISLLLADFKANRQQMAIVVDEFGGTAGIVTLEDVLEEIVGEYDDETSPPTKIIRRQTHDGCFFVHPSARLEDLERRIGYDFGSSTCITLTGLIYHRLGRVAQPGDRIDLPGLQIVIEAKDGHRLMEVCLKRQVSSNN